MLCYFLGVYKGGVVGVRCGSGRAASGAIGGTDRPVSSCHAASIFCCAAQSGGMEARGVRQDRIRERADTVAFVREEGLIGEQNKVGSVYSRRIGLWVYLGHGYRGIIIKGVAGVGLQRQVGQSGNISVF